MTYLTSGKNKIMGSSVSTDADVITVIDENSTDEQIPSAKAVYDKLSDLPTDSGSKCYTTLDELGLTADATVEDVIDALPKGGSALLGVTEFTNYQTIFPYEEGNDQFARVYIVKGTEDGSRVFARWFRKDGVKEAIAIFNTNDNKFNGWQKIVTENKITNVLANTSKTDEVPNANLVANEIHGKYFDIADYSNALAMPAGKWRVDSNNKASQMQNLPVPKAGILEVKYLQGSDGQTAYTGTFKYAMLTYTAIDGNKYERSFNSDGTVGNIVNDTGWKTVIIENAWVDPYSCTGYKRLTGTEDLFTLETGHYLTEKANTAYNYPITDSSQLTAHIYVLGHLNDKANNKGYRIILYFDNKNRMYRINEWWGNFVNNGWQNMQAIGNSMNYSKRSFSINSWNGYSSGDIYYQSLNGICYITVSGLCILSGEKTNSTQLPADLVPATDVAQNLIDNNGKIIGRITIAEGNRTLIVKHLSSNNGDDASLTFSYPIKTS